MMFVRVKNSYININAIREFNVGDDECYLELLNGERRSIAPQEAIDSLVALEANGRLAHSPHSPWVTDWQTGEDLPPSLRIDA